MTVEDSAKRNDPLDEQFLPVERRLLRASAGGQRGFLLLRLVLAAILLFQTLWGRDGELRWSWFSSIPLLYAAASFSLYRLRRSQRLSDRLGPGTFLLDVAACLAVLRVTVGTGPHFFTALLLLILGACLVRKPLWIFTIGIGVCLGYAYLAFPAAEEIPRVLPLHLSLLLLIGLFGVHIADYAAFVERETARRYEERLAWMQRLSMVGKAMAAVLHETKTPIGSIVLNAESAASLLKAGKKPASELRVIAEEADHAAAVLQNFLDFVKPTRLDLRPLDAREPLDQAVEMLKIRMDERGVTLSVAASKGCEILGSARHLVQAFSNILNNAVDAMPSGGRLAVRMEKEGGDVRFHFVDSGIGLSPAALKTVFEPFATSKPGEEGHGLGMGIVRWIVQEHGGRIAIDSAGPACGAHVTLSLPLAGKS